MKKMIFISLAATTLLFAENTEMFNPKDSKHITIKLDMLNKSESTPIGEVVAVQTKYGVAFYPNLTNLEPGLHGFHVHEKPDCGATEKGLGLKAGGHWDPKKQEGIRFLGTTKDTKETYQHSMLIKMAKQPILFYHQKSRHSKN